MAVLRLVCGLFYGSIRDYFGTLFMVSLWAVLWLNWRLIFRSKKREIGLISFMKIVAPSENLMLGFLITKIGPL